LMVHHFLLDLFTHKLSVFAILCKVDSFNLV
jgi:hypothetical protein